MKAKLLVTGCILIAAAVKFGQYSTAARKRVSKYLRSSWRDFEPR